MTPDSWGCNQHILSLQAERVGSQIMSWVRKENKRCLFSNILCRTWQPWWSCHLSLQREIILWLCMCMNVIVCMAPCIFFQIQSQSLTSCVYQTPALWHLFFFYLIKADFPSSHFSSTIVRLWRETKVCINDMTTYKLVSHSNISFKPQNPLLHHHTPHGGKHLQSNPNAFDSIAK